MDHLRLIFHHCFDATEEDIEQFIDEYYSSHPFPQKREIRISRYDPEGMNKKKYPWFYDQESVPYLDQYNLRRDPLYSYHEYAKIGDSGTSTEVRLWCSDIELLVGYYIKVARDLWYNLPRADLATTLVSDQEPVFKNPLDFDIKEAEKIPPVPVEEFPDWGIDDDLPQTNDVYEPSPIEDTEDKEPQSDEEIIQNTTLMKKYYKDYNPVTAKNIYDAIPNGYSIYDEEGGRWGPAMIARKGLPKKTTIGRYLKAFKSAGITEIKKDGESIPIP
jgi:hypothetical protein